MKIILLIYANDEKYIYAGNRLFNQAKEAQIFDDIIYIQPRSYPEYFKNFLLENKVFFKENQRGYGYWLWKPFLVQYNLSNHLSENDILLYMDSGCELSILGIPVFRKYIELTTKHGALFFSTKFKESQWTKKDLFTKLNANHHKLKKQVQASFFFLQNNEKSRTLAKTWYEIGLAENYRFIDDSPSIEKNFKIFVEHRHDQSILSLLVHNTKFPIINNDFNYNKSLFYNNAYILKYPIHALRNCTSESLLNKFIKKSNLNSCKSIYAVLSFASLNLYIFSKIFLYRQYFKVRSIFQTRGHKSQYR